MSEFRCCRKISTSEPTYGRKLKCNYEGLVVVSARAPSGTIIDLVLNGTAISRIFISSDNPTRPRMAFANARNIALRDVSITKIYGDLNTYNAQGDIIVDASPSESGRYQFSIQLILPTIYRSHEALPRKCNRCRLQFIRTSSSSQVPSWNSNSDFIRYR